MHTAILVCETVGCKNQHNTVNEVKFDDAHSFNLFAEGYGQGSEDLTTDACPICGKLAAFIDM